MSDQNSGPQDDGVTVESDIIYRQLRPASDPETFYPGLESQTITLPAGSTYGPTGGQDPVGSRWHGGTRELPVDILFERDVPVVLRDGTTIFVDVYRPPGATDVPAIIAWSPYGKEGGFWSHAVGHVMGFSAREEWISGLQKFEGPDPAEWVANGYAVINADAPGSYSSEGDLHWFGTKEGKDGYDLVEWVADQEWSNGRVGLEGNSWLSVIQWFIAAEQPPHLAAIAPWNGFADVYEGLIAPGGMPLPGFPTWMTNLLNGNRVEDLVAMIDKYPLKNAYWAAKEAAVEKVTVPAYVAAGPQPGFLHRFTSEVFRQLPTEEKWLRIFNTDEWYFQYAPEYVADLRRFFDHYLKGENNGWESTPRVRVAVLDPGLEPDQQANHEYADAAIYLPAAEVDRPEHEWPIARTRYATLHLDASAGALVDEPLGNEATAEYPAVGGGTTFTYTFTEDTDVIGYVVAKLWLEVTDGQDADLFVRLDKLGVDGRFQGVINVEGLRVSHREIDEERSTDFMIYHTHREEQLLEPGERVPVTIGLAPIAVRFRAGEQLRLQVAGDMSGAEPAPAELASSAQMFAPPVSRNTGTHIVHSGGQYDSYLVLPIVPPK
ncbi:CocE/NonD family hydrolase [Leifsonia poae]|uniref:CocE/NonD family hydrolase n=1 Tax=Leifsonia poae TaxID=110933 RepID=UPI003D674685